MSDDRLTPAQAAERLGISREAVYVLNSRKGNGFPEAVYIGRTPMWTASQLDAWRATHPSKQPARRRAEPRALKQSTAVNSHALRAHLAFATARRHASLTPGQRSLAEDAMHAAALELGAEIEQLHSRADLIEITVRYPADTSIAHLAKRLRGAAGRAIRRSQHSGQHMWAKQYYAASIEAHSSAALSDYVERLEQPANN